VIVGSAFEAPTIIACLDYIAVVGQSIQQRGGHLCVAEHAWPFNEGEIGGDDDRSALVETADEVEQELAAGLSERQVAEFIEDDEVHAGQMIGETALASVAGLGLEPVDEIDHVVEPAADAGADASSRNGDGKMGFAGAGPTDQHGIALLCDEAAAGEVVHERLVDRRALELEVVEVLGERQLGDGELILDRPCLLLVDLRREQIANDALRLMLAFDGLSRNLGDDV
jgi:hypothetical protein